MRKLTLGRLAVYAVLLVGTVAFSFPFVWMAGSSVKVDQELYTQELRVLPQEALPRDRSPYYEERRLDPLPGTNERRAEVLPRIEELVTQRLPALPPDGIVPVAQGRTRRSRTAHPRRCSRGTSAD